MKRAVWNVHSKPHSREQARKQDEKVEIMIQVLLLHDKAKEAFESYNDQRNRSH